MTDWRLTTEDRVAQVNWMQEFAANLAQNMGEGTAEEIVEYALSDEAQYSWNITMPDWFDEQDRTFLVSLVAENL